MKVGNLVAIKFNYEYDNGCGSKKEIKGICGIILDVIVSELKGKTFEINTIKCNRGDISINEKDIIGFKVLVD